MTMTYDTWKCTNPADEFLGPLPEDEDAFFECPECGGDPDYHMVNNGWPCFTCNERGMVPKP